MPAEPQTAQAKPIMARSIFALEDVDPADTRMELTCGGAKMAILYLQDHYGATQVADMVAQTRMNLDYLLNRSNWMSLAYYYRFLGAMVEMTGDPMAPFKAGKYATRRDCFGPVAVILARLGSVSGTFRTFVRINHLFNKVADWELLSISRHGCTVRGSYRRHEQDRNNCLALQGVFAALPELHGYPPAHVEHPVCACDGAEACEYVISWSPMPSFRYALTWGLFGGFLGLALQHFGGTTATRIGFASVPVVLGYLFGRTHDYAAKMKHSLRNRDEHTKSLETSMQETEKLNEDLQAQVEARTTALRQANSALETAYANLEDSRERELAQHRTAAIGVLAAGMAHELNTPLSTIQLAIQGLGQGGVEGEGARDLLKGSRRAASRCARIVRDLLAFSREPQRVSMMRLHEVVGATLSVFRGEKPEGISVVSDIATPPPIAHVDGAQIQQAMLNLLNNASDAMQQKGQVRVTLRQQDGHALVQVADHGPGIPADKLATIFKPFTSSKREEGTGLGLGLSIAAELTSKNGGTIDVTSTEGEGACFTLRFPLADPQSVADLPPSGLELLGPEVSVEGGIQGVVPVTSKEASSESPRTPPELSQDALHILLVEDDADAGRTLDHMLAYSDIRVTHVLSGLSGIETFDGSIFDAVVTDVLLGDITGLDVLRAIREKDEDFPVVLLTGHDSMDSAIEALRLGAQDYIQKPLERIDDLANPIRSAVKHHRLLLQARQLNTKLRSSEVRFRNLAELLPETVLEADVQGRVTFLNQAGMERFGYDQAHIDEGLHLTDGVCLEERSRVGQILQSVLAGETVGGVEFRATHRLGETFPVLTFSSLMQVAGEAAGIRCIVVDVTQQKADQERILAYQDALREMNFQLQVAEEQERQVLAADLHDSIAQLLAVAKVRVSLAARQAGDQYVLDNLAEANTLISSMIKQTHSLIFQLSPPSLDEHGIWAALVDLVDHVHQLHGLEVTLIPADRDLSLDKTARVHMFRAVRELIVNVAKHAKVKRCEVSARTDGSMVSITVHDDGVGFAQNEDSEGKSNSGYGLFGVRERLRAVGGALSVESTEGKGTDATVTIPM